MGCWQRGLTESGMSIVWGAMSSEKQSTESAWLLAAERDVQERLGDSEFDFASLDAISNLYRAAAAIRRRAEGEVLAPYSLSFGAFTILWVLWIWDDMETAQLAQECNLAKGTLTGMLNTLEKRGLVERNRMETDMRRMMVCLTSEGRSTITEVFPKFNSFEGEMSNGLTLAEKAQLADLLRRVTKNAQ